MTRLLRATIAAAIQRRKLTRSSLGQMRVGVVLDLPLNIKAEGRRTCECLVLSGYRECLGVHAVLTTDNREGKGDGGGRRGDGTETDGEREGRGDSRIRRAGLCP
jgi:hypothetical protein